MIWYYMHLGPDQKPADINSMTAIITSKDYGLGSPGEVFPRILQKIIS